MTHAILTAIGVDRPGIVDEVSRFILECGGNIEDSRMVNFRGQFVVMVLVGGDEATLGKLRHEGSRLASSSGLSVDVLPAGAGGAAAAAAPAPGALPYRFVATAVDQAGLVQRVSRVLREMNVNIESLDTRLSPAPYTGSPVFEMEMVVVVPRATQLNALRQKLGAACDELNMDWELERA